MVLFRPYPPPGEPFLSCLNMGPHTAQNEKHTGQMTEAIGKGQMTTRIYWCDALQINY